MEILKARFEKVQVLGLDEAYVDFSDKAANFLEAARLLEDLRSAIFTKTGLTVSAGLSDCKLLAKIGSECNKPNGQYIILPDDKDDFLYPLPLEKIPGVGPQTLKKCWSLNLKTCGDFRQMSLDEACSHFLSFGSVLYQYVRGDDPRELELSRQRKSLSVERTLSENISEEYQVLSFIDELYAELESRLSEKKIHDPLKSAFVKMKNDQFEKSNMENQILDKPLKSLFLALGKNLFQKQNRPLRLIGLGVRFASEEQTPQLELPL